MNNVDVRKEVQDYCTEVAQLICYADVLVRQPRDKKLATLSRREINELVNLDSEIYRVKNSV
jgi:hypothetical protein